MWEVKEYVTRLEVSPKGSCSLLEGLRINSQSSDNLELAIKELWNAAACLRGGDELKIIGIQEMGYRQVIS